MATHSLVLRINRKLSDSRGGTGSEHPVGTSGAGEEGRGKYSWTVTFKLRLLTMVKSTTKGVKCPMWLGMVGGRQQYDFREQSNNNFTVRNIMLHSRRHN